MNATAKAQYRVETLTFTANPKYIRGSFAAATRNHEVISKAFTFFNTLEAAQAGAAKTGGRVQELSASGKSYRPVK